MQTNKAIKSSEPINETDLLNCYELFKSEVLFNSFNLIEPFDFIPIGSFNKKVEGDLYSDIDIAINSKSISYEFFKKWVIGRFDHKLSPGFNQISIGYPFDQKIVQIDLMFRDNLEWAKEMYHSPNFKLNESKFKGVYRNMLLMSVVTSNSFEPIDELTYKQNSLRLDTGLWKTTKTYWNSTHTKILKNPRLIPEEDEFITNDFSELKRILFHDDRIKIDTFERLFKIISFLDIKDVVLLKFNEYLRSNNLSLDWGLVSND